MVSNEQKKIDFDKWIDSEKKKQDMCGKYDFCAYCDKTLDNPCAKAVQKIVEALKETPYKSEKK